MLVVAEVVVLLGVLLGVIEGPETPPPPPPPEGTPHVRSQQVNQLVTDAEKKAAEQKETAVVQRSGQAPPSSPAEAYVYWTLEWEPGDAYCLRRHSTTDRALAQGAHDALWSKSFAEANGGTRQECPATPPKTRPPAEVEDGLARQFWDVRILPDPVLQVVPDFAITGKPAYLQIAGEQRKHFDVGNPLGDDVAIDATSHYEIDWGDHTTTTTSSQGGPWPGGDVTHVYTEVSPGAVITVRQVWSAHWSAGRNSGDLTDLRTGATLTLRVDQVQAVING